MSLPNERRAGACLHITSLPGKYGVGGLGHEAKRFIDCLDSMGMRVWQFLPINALGHGCSPYSPLSIYAGNTLLLDVEGLIEHELLEPADVSDLAQLPADHTDYDRLIPLKFDVLDRAADRFETRASPEQREAYAQFRARHDARWLTDYALYVTLANRYQGRSWMHWDSAHARREESAMRELQHAEKPAIERVKILQFLFYQQWEELRDYARKRGVTFFGDVPIYISLESADAWAKPELLQMDSDGRPARVAGVPPDYFSEDGQRWGNPLYNWSYHADTGYQWWIDRLKHAAEFADILRIDHFRAFESYWAIPAESPTAREGQWEIGPGDAIFHALRGALGELPLVAEDLGLITDAVHALRDRHELPGMSVLQFMVGDAGFDLSHISWNRVCYTGTHDNDTTVGWFSGGPSDNRSAEEIHRTQEAALRHSQGRPETIHIDLIRLALRSAARLAIIPVQDLLGLDAGARMNRPGTTDGNWQWRLLDAQLDPSFCKTVRDMVVESGRSE